MSGLRAKHEGGGGGMIYDLITRDWMADVNVVLPRLFLGNLFYLFTWVSVI